MTGDYSLRHDCLHLALALTIAVVSHDRQKRSFYLTGLLSTGFALYYITDHYEWVDRPLWAVPVILVGLLALRAGLGLYRRERARKRLG